MKLILSKIFAILIKILNLINFLLKKIILYLSTVKVYFDKSECKKLKDCLLLAKLKAQQPPGADRAIEYPWMIENIKLKSGKLLDVGSTAGRLLADFLPDSVEIYCLNLNPKKIENNRIKVITGDIRKTDFLPDYFDYITCISTLEHIGVSGRYGSDDDRRGDIKAMEEIKRILKPGGELLITVPYGIKDVLPINKLYNKERLNILLNNFYIIEQTFIKYNQRWGIWLKATEAEAAKTDMIKDGWYALALIKVLKK